MSSHLVYQETYGLCFGTSRRMPSLFRGQYLLFAPPRVMEFIIFSVIFLIYPKYWNVIIPELQPLLQMTVGAMFLSVLQRLLLPANVSIDGEGYFVLAPVRTSLHRCADSVHA